MVYIVFLKEVDHTSSLIVVRTSTKMDIVWILSVLIGLTLSEKLDRTYLPPPGSKFSGGSPGAIDVPLEFPKETYSSRMGDNSFGRPEVAIGIDRVGPNISPEKYGDISSTEQSLQGNSFSFPTTSTSFAFSQTTSFVPAASSTIGPDILINSKYPNSISINNHFDHDRPFNGFNILEEAQVLNDDKKISQNQISDNGITPQGANKINDESVHSNNRNIFNIPTIHSQSGDLGIQGITSSPLSDEIDHSLFHNNYDTYYSPSPSEPISLKDGNIMPSTSIPSNNINTKTLSNSPVSITNTPYSYRTLPERKQSQDREAVILNYENTITPDGYAYSFDTSNGIHADEKGTAINGVQAVGSYSYIGDDGQLYNVSYTADENGFRPYGAHLPTAPPIPDAILKVIEQATIDKANGIYDDGSYDDSKYGYRKYNPKNNIMILNQNKKDKDGTNLNTNVYNTHLPYYTRLNENLNKNNGTIRENEQNTLKNNIPSFIKNGLLNESLSEIAPNYKSNFEIIKEEHIKNTVNDDDKKLQNNISNSVPHLEDIGKNKIMSIEVIDELGYHYSKPQNKYSLEAADNVINRFSETPASTTVPAMYKKIVENKPARPFMTPYVSRNDDISGKHGGNDQPLDIPALYHKEEEVILNNQKTNLPIIDTNMILGKSNENIHNFVNKFKRPDIYLAEGQGYLYSKNGIPRNDSLVSHITSTENGISDITSSLPTDFPSRFNTMETNEKIPQNPSEHSESSFLQNQNVLLDQENYRGPVTHSNKQNSYGNIYNEDDSGFRYNMANMNEANRDTIEYPTTRTYGEDFSGPKRPQTYDSLTGYHY